MRAVLERLERRLVDQRAQVIDHLRPGLSDDEIDAAMDGTGLQLPEEARELFRWHDGTRPDPPHLRERTLAPGGWEFHSLRERVEALGVWRAELEEAASAEGWEPVWAPKYFPLLQGPDSGMHCLIRAAHRHVFPNEVVYGEWPAVSPRDALRHFSLYSLFETWLLWIEAGHVRWDRELRTWIHIETLHWTTYRAGFD